MELMPSGSKTRHSPPLRVGIIGYLNTFPLRHVLKSFPYPLEILLGTPAELNQALLAGQLDVATVSSVWYLQHQQTLQLLPCYSISSMGPVQSVLYLSQQPRRSQLAESKTLWALEESWTSVSLFQALWQQEQELEQNRGSIETVMLFAAADWERVLEEEGQALLIGDTALRFWVSRFRNQVHVEDLGALWWQKTETPLVFGVLAAHQASTEFFQKKAPVLEALQECLKGALTPHWVSNHLTNSSPHFELEASALGLSLPLLKTYLTQRLNFEWTPKHQQGLQRLEKTL
jgi:predicted solute-binding protein